METVQFGGPSCHIMKPELTAHLVPPQPQVARTSCHIAAGTTGRLRKWRASRPHRAGSTGISGESLMD